MSGVGQPLHHFDYIVVTKLTLQLRRQVRVVHERRDLQQPIFVDGWCGRVLIQHAVPFQQRVDRALGVRIVRVQPFEQRHQRPGRQRCMILLKLFKILDIELLLLAQHLRNAVIAIWWVVFVPQRKVDLRGKICTTSLLADA